jgi:hypothetical protein
MEFMTALGGVWRDAAMTDYAGSTSPLDERDIVCATSRHACRLEETLFDGFCSPVDEIKTSE